MGAFSSFGVANILVGVVDGENFAIKEASVHVRKKISLRRKQTSVS